MSFATKHHPVVHDAVAPDGSHVRVLLTLAGGSAAHFELGSGQTSVAVRHRTVEEIWYVLGGDGEMWRSEGSREETVVVHAGTCLTIPVATTFQFRCTGATALCAVGITMPPWPGDGEAVLSDGPWEPTVTAGPGLG